MANTTVTREQLNKILDELFPVDENSSEREKRGVEKLKTEYMTCYFAPDILKFRGTAWGAVNAMSDMISHNAPRRKTENYGKTTGAESWTVTSCWIKWPLCCP